MNGTFEALHTYEHPRLKVWAHMAEVSKMFGAAQRPSMPGRTRELGILV